MHHDPTSGPEMSIEASEDELAVQISAAPAESQARSRMRDGFRSGLSQNSNLEASGVWASESRRDVAKRSTVRDPSRHQHP